MKKTILFFSGLILAFGIMAQVPQGISHQAVIRDANNQLVVNSAIGIQVSILQGSAEGEAVYIETHTPISNASGLITYVIGQGVVESGVFDEIDWSDLPYFLKTEADPQGGIDYSITGVTQFLSVPYALYSGTAKAAETIIGSISPNIKPPIVLAVDADPVGEVSATVNGVVNAEGFSTTVAFEWGTTTDYGNTINALQSPVTGSDDVSVHANLSGLEPATTYHYRIRAINAVDVTYSQDMMFTTETSIPQLSTLAVSGITTSSAVSGGDITFDGGLPVNQRGIVWSTTPNPTMENNEGITYEGSGDGSFTSQLLQLSHGTVYYLRAYAKNDNGTGYGNQQVFSTLGAVPTAATLQATEITPGSAVLNAMVNPNHLETTVIFEYGLTDVFGNEVVADQSPLEGSVDTPISVLIDDLEPLTTYYFRVVAENELGVSFGNAFTLFTCGANIEFTYRGEEVTYGTILRGGLCWLDRNLGADPMPFIPGEDAAGSTDARLYGDLFQWGRLDDGHQDRHSNTTSTLSNTDVPGHGDFITVDSAPWDWRSPQNNNLWQGEDGINNPCPPGWRVPTHTELNTERQSWSSNNMAGAFASALKWPASGYRDNNGTLINEDGDGVVWSSGIIDEYSRILYFYGTFADISNSYRTYGLSIRCVRDVVDTEDD